VPHGRAYFTLVELVKELDHREDDRLEGPAEVGDPAYEDIVDNYAASRLGMLKNVPWDIEKIHAERKAMLNLVANNNITISKCGICGDPFIPLTGQTPSVDGNPELMICSQCQHWCR
jgi:hypothetical protein